MDDVDEFVAALKQHHEAMRALAVRTMHDQSLADDALQNAYTSAFTNRASFRGDAAFSTWLYRIVYRSCIDEIRRRKPTQQLDDDLATDLRFEDVIETKMQLRRALGTLTPEHRAAVWLIDAEGHSYRDTATILDIAEGTVASRVVRARAALQQALGIDAKEIE